MTSCPSVKWKLRILLVFGSKETKAESEYPEIDTAKKSNGEEVIYIFGPTFIHKRRQYLDFTVYKTKWNCRFHEYISQFSEW